MTNVVARRRGVAALVLLAAVAAVGAHAQCQISAGGLVFDLSKANNGNDVTVAMGSTGYNAIMNSCKGIATPDQIVCQNGTLACQKAASTGAAFKAMARQLTTSTYNGATLVVTYDNGDNCPNASPPVNRKVVISYTCNQSPPSGNPTYINENPSCQYNFNWASPAGCGTVAPSTPAPTTPAPTTATPTTPTPRLCSLEGTWRSQYYDSVEGNLLVEDILTFKVNDTFVQVLEPYPTDACDINTLIWEGTYIQVNQTNFRMAFIYCEVSQLGCLNCTPSGDFQITSKFQSDCSSFTYRSQDESQGVRTYYRFDDDAVAAAQQAKDGGRLSTEDAVVTPDSHEKDLHEYYYIDADVPATIPDSFYRRDHDDDDEEEEE